MAMSPQFPVAMKVPRIVVTLAGNLLSYGTGILVRIGGGNRFALLSNYHVLSGRNVLGQPMHPTGALPINLRIEIPGMGEIEIPYNNGGQAIQLIRAANQNVDLAGIVLTEDQLGHRAQPLQIQRQIPDIQEDMMIAPGLSVCVVGYPGGRHDGNGFPIWVTGNVASEFLGDIPEMPSFLISAGTQAGLSGAPVFLVGGGSYLTSSGGMFVGAGIHMRFLGLYSGRLSSPDAPDGLTQVGIVWKPLQISGLIHALEASL
jgi:hypothetical protein